MIRSCPTCKHEHHPPHPAELKQAVDALASITNTAAEVGAQICHVWLAPGHISITIGTADGLRELATKIGLPEPSLDDNEVMDTQGNFDGVPVYLCGLRGK